LWTFDDSCIKHICDYDFRVFFNTCIALNYRIYRCTLYKHHRNTSKFHDGSKKFYYFYKHGNKFN
jgi:hypothetical protein